MKEGGHRLLAGSAQAAITPPPGGFIFSAGYGSRDRPSEEVDDDLFVKALALDDGNMPLILISADLLDIPSSIARDVRNMVRKRLGIPPHQIMICATHNHFAPLVDGGSGYRLLYKSYGADPKILGLQKAYRSLLIVHMVDVAERAWKGRIPARLGFGISKADGLSYNRRTLGRDGKCRMSFLMPPEEERKDLVFGPVDPDVRILRVDSEDGTPVATVVNFSCHPVCGSIDRLYAFSADYPGEMRRAIEGIWGGICIFTLGCAGDIVPIERGAAARRKIGLGLAGSVLQKLPWISMAEDVRLCAGQIAVRVRSKSGREIRTTLTAFRIGDLVSMISFPGEVLVELWLMLKEGWEGSPLIPITLANESVGYICHSKAYDEGGYEPGDYCLLAQGEGERIISFALKLLNKAYHGHP